MFKIRKFPLYTNKIDVIIIFFTVWLQLHILVKRPEPWYVMRLTYYRISNDNWLHLFLIFIKYSLYTPITINTQFTRVKLFFTTKVIDINRVCTYHTMGNFWTKHFVNNDIMAINYSVVGFSDREPRAWNLYINKHWCHNVPKANFNAIYWTSKYTNKFHQK